VIVFDLAKRSWEENRDLFLLARTKVGLYPGLPNRPMVLSTPAALAWYNNNHQHSALGYVTPMQRRSGEATAIHARRNQTLQDAFAKNPLRWRLRKVRSYQCIPVFAFYRPAQKAS
jgi:hypothetical protein